MKYPLQEKVLAKADAAMRRPSLYLVIVSEESRAISKEKSKIR